ncbi:MAG: transporter substrate-binding domain-containing protein [Oscillospiraceae bacterium]|jgi:polar amino acid transport system substrate-binding protein|nr:transporter substrate-binding domain-containing protein [Oscillospiraceae bacterium]
MKTKRALALLCAAVLVLLLFAGCGPAKKDKPASALITPGVLTIGSEIGYPPMEYTTDNGLDYIGFDIDVGKAIGDLLGLEVKFVNTAWDGIFAGLEQGQYDMIMSAVSITPDRQEKYILTKPYVSNAQAIITRPGADEAINDPSKFEGKRVAVQTATTSADILEEMVANGAKIEIFPYEKVTSCFDDLLLDRADAVFVDSVVAAYYLQGDNAKKFVRTYLSDEPEPMAICIAKGNDKLAAAVEAAVDTLNYNGTMELIAVKNFGEDFTSGLREVTEEPVIPSLD